VVTGMGPGQGVNMTENSIYAGVSKVAQVYSGTSESCKVCRKGLDATSDFGGAVNHYLDHGYVLLHLGQQTSRADEGLWQETVAILGQV
jgi:hypothetical protein